MQTVLDNLHAIKPIPIPQCSDEEYQRIIDKYLKKGTIMNEVNEVVKKDASTKPSLPKHEQKREADTEIKK